MLDTASKKCYNNNVNKNKQTFQTRKESDLL